MERRQMGTRIYLRVDKDEEVLDAILAACTQHGVRSAIFQGIGACGAVGIQTYVPQTDSFFPTEHSGMFEIVNLNSNVTCDEAGTIYQHAHALFAKRTGDGEEHLIAGHLRSATVRYTAEIAIDPVQDGIIGRKTDPATGITVWDLGA